LEHKVDVNNTDSLGNSALMVAILGLHYDVVQVLLAAEANINYTHDSGFTPLHLAIQVSKLDIIKLLIDSNADVNANGPDSTPLRLAVYSNNIEAVKYLIAASANVNSLDFEGCTVLHIAAKKNLVEIVVLL